MKQLISVILLAILIACGGGDKQTKKTPPPPAPTYSYQTPTQEMLNSGQATYDKHCWICHKEGVGGAAKLSDKTRWTNNRTKDLDLLVQHVHDGYTGEYGTMTPKGTCIECSKDELRNAIFYMMTEAGVLE